MLVTEEEARKSICCRDLGKRCQASDCMAWDFGPLTQSVDQRSGVSTKVKRGYCGLALPRFSMKGWI